MEQKYLMYALFSFADISYMGIKTCLPIIIASDAQISPYKKGPTVKDCAAAIEQS